MTEEQLLASIDEKTCLDFLARTVQHKSYSQTDGESALAAFMAHEMQGLGLEASLTPVPGNRVNVIGRWRGAGGGKSLLFNSHVDTNRACR